MRVTSHCATHPSREATVRCRACGKWLCERCSRRIAGHIYCGVGCRSHDLWRHGREVVTSIAATRVHPAWTALTIVAAVTLLTISLVKTSGRLLAEASGNQSAESAPAVSGRLRPADTEGRSDLVVEGPPHAAVLVSAAGHPILVAVLDGAGRTSIQLPAGTEGRLDMVLLQGPAAHLELPALSSRSNAEPRTEPTCEPDHETARSDRPPVPTVRARIIVQPLTRFEIPDAVRPRQIPTPGASAGSSPPRVASRAMDPGIAPRRRSPTTVRDAPPVLHLLTDVGPRLALTFDGNTLAEGTSALLDTLSRLDLRVTLFVTGQFIHDHPGLVRRAVLSGHEVGNHSYSHPHLTSWAQNHRHDTLPTVSRASLADELRRTEAEFQQATGRPMAPLWRAPFGEENAQLRAWALEEGYLHVRWSSLEGASLDSLDWVNDEHSALYRDPERMMRRLLRFPRLEGGIVLMHLASERPTPPWTALPDLVQSLRDREIELVQVSALLEASPTWRPWLERARQRHSRSSRSGSAPRR